MVSMFRFTTHPFIQAIFLSIGLLGVMTTLPGIALGQESPSASFTQQLVQAAIERTQQSITYDGSYHQIPFPMGDVPANIGVCTDVVIRTYRVLGIDLQALVHQDMKTHFSQYPRNWGLKQPDPNIDHRRVPNLQTFFTRHGMVLPVTLIGSDYQPGDLVTWTVAGRLPHIGIVSDQTVPGTHRPLIVHNIGKGPKLEDMLFHFPITGHYRYGPP